MSRPCVLIVVENLPVPMDRRVWQEACALRDAGYKVVVICPQMRGFTTPEEEIDGITIYRHWISEEAGRFFHFFREYFSALWGEFWLACKAWRRHRFQIIHICNPPDIIFLAALPFKLLGCRIVYDVHDVWPEMYEAKFGKKGFTYRLVRLAERLTYACADVVLATNESVRQIALKRGGKSDEKVFVVRTAPQKKSIAGQDTPELKKDKRFLVGYVGVMGDVDGVHLLMEAAAHLVHQLGRKDVQFLLMGTGPEYERLVELRHRLKLVEYVDMPGRVSDEFLQNSLKTIDLGVSCDPINDYNHHCTMNKVLDYMAYGKPQVMFDLREGRASAGQSALYVQANSAVKLAEAIDQLLSDSSKRQKMGSIGAERIRADLNWERSVEQLSQAYERVLGARGQPED